MVGLLAPNSSAFAVAFHGILRAGATATTVNALFTAKDIAKQLTDSGAKMLVTVTPMLKQAKEAAAGAGIADGNLVVLDGEVWRPRGTPTPPTSSPRERLRRKWNSRRRRTLRCFDLGEFLGNIAEHRYTIAFIAPPVAVALAKHPLVDSR